MKKLKFTAIFILIISIIGLLMNFMLLLKIKAQMSVPLVPKGVMDSKLIPQYFYIGFYILVSSYLSFALIKKRYSKFVLLLFAILIVLSFVFETIIKNFIFEYVKI